MRSSTLPLALATAAATAAFVRAQTCYFPDGSINAESAPCGDGDSDKAVACCPLNWICLSNGLCRFEAKDWLDRYSCSDRMWGKGGCARGVCDEHTRSNGTASGGEAIGVCPNGKFCCNGDRSGNCCKDGKAQYFALPEARVVGTVTALLSAPHPGISKLDPVGAFTSMGRTSTDAFTGPVGSSATRTSIIASTGEVVITVPSSSSDAEEKSFKVTAAATDVSAATQTRTSLTSDAAGRVSTVYIVTTSTPPSSPQSSTQTRTTTLGLAIGVPLAALALAGSAFMLLLLRRRRSKPLSAAGSSAADAVDCEGEKRVSELDGFPKADTRGGTHVAPAWVGRRGNRRNSGGRGNGGGGGGGDGVGGKNGVKEHAHTVSEIEGREVAGPGVAPVELDAVATAMATARTAASAPAGGGGWGGGGNGVSGGGGAAAAALAPETRPGAVATARPSTPVQELGSETAVPRTPVGQTAAPAAGSAGDSTMLVSPLVSAEGAAGRQSPSPSTSPSPLRWGQQRNGGGGGGGGGGGAGAGYEGLVSPLVEEAREFSHDRGLGIGTGAVGRGSESRGGNGSGNETGASRTRYLPYRAPPDAAELA